jgi:hypothetical protein
MRAIFKSVWVRKLIGKLGVPYNRRLGVRGSSHPLFYDADLSLPAADSNAFRIQRICSVQSVSPALDGLGLIGANRAYQNPPFHFLPIFGRPTFFFHNFVYNLC